MPADPALLFGALAHQLGFVTREVLVACAEEARRSPKTGLEALLLAPGRLSAEDAAAVRAMAVVVLQRNAGDLARALRDAAPDESLREALTGRPSGARKTHVPGEKAAAPSRYTLGRELGRGGLGKVVEARDAVLDREVAIKLVMDGLPADLAERFVREARLTARLEHPNIVPIHDCGELEVPGGGRRMFLCMKKVQGRDLGKVIRSLSNGDPEAVRHWTRPRLLRVFQDICLGVAFAHDRGVIHRDLKPANVMIGDYGETLIVDWGLAKESGTEDAKRARVGGNSDPALTLDGALIGTPQYMSPEQAAGRADAVDARSDIYALGAILYEILTLRPPVEGDSVADVITRVREGRILPPSSAAGVPRATASAIQSARAGSARDAVPPELDAIVLKAMSLRPADRHASARSLHDDIQLFLEGTRESERRAREAAERIAAGRARLARFREQRKELEHLKARIREEACKLDESSPVEARRTHWELQARLRALAESRLDESLGAASEFRQALLADPGSRQAHDGVCETICERLFEAERDHDLPGVLHWKKTLSHEDRGGAFVSMVGAPGTVTVRAWGYACACLRPARTPGWRVEFGREGKWPLVDGRAAPGAKVDLETLMVPGITVRPEGARFGHVPECPRREVEGVEVWIARYEERDRRLVPGEPKLLGRTPVVAASVPQGSWLCTLRPGPGFWGPFPVPVLVGRSADSALDLVLFDPAEVPGGFRYVPGGEFVSGGDTMGAYPVEMRRTQDVLIGDAPVTCGEYLEFLDDLASNGRMEEARARMPRDAEGLLAEEADGRIRIPKPGRQPQLSPELPVVGVSWHDAVAYAEWRSTRDGRVYRLPLEYELEKAARGVDARQAPYGAEVVGCYANILGTFKDRTTLLPPGSFPADVSPYGIHDLGGNAASWSWNTVELRATGMFSVRGGAWFSATFYAQSPVRAALSATATRKTTGFRLAMPVFREP